MARPSDPVARPRLITRPFLLVTGASLVFFVYIGVMVPLIPRLIEERMNGGEIEIGANLAAFGIAAIAARPALSRLGERHGLRTMMLAGALLTAAAVVVNALILNRWLLLPLRGLQGVGEAGVFVGASTMISGLAGPLRRAEAASYFSVAVFGGLGLGPIVGEAVVGHDRFRAGLLVGAAFAAAAALCILFVHDDRPPARSRAERTGERLPRFHTAAVRPGVVLALGIGGYTVFASFMPAHAKAIGLGSSKWIFAEYSVVCLVLRLAGARIPERVGLFRAVTVALSSFVVGLTVLAVVPNAVGAFGATLLIAVAMSFMYPSMLALTLGAVPESERVRAVSTFTAFFEVGSAYGGLVLAGVAQVTSKRGGFVAGACSAGLALWLLWKVLVPHLGGTPAQLAEDDGALFTH